MGFSSELCSPQGHGAVQQMQEAELRLLEGMRKWMAQRVKSDREYAGLLHHMSLQDSGGQSRSSSPDSPVSQVGFRGALPAPGPVPKPSGIGLEIWQAQAWEPLSPPPCLSLPSLCHSPGPRSPARRRA
jgi:hypothetical protein